MEVKIVRELKALPKVFMIKELNKFTITEKYLDCVRYKSRSGLTQQGCLEYDGRNIKEVRGIYYVPAPPIFKFSSRRKAISTLDDVIELLEQIKPLYRLADIGINTGKVLVEWNNYYVSIYEKFTKGLMLEFPLLSQQGNLRIYRVVPPSDAYFVSVDNSGEKKTLNEAMFSPLSKLIIYNHEINFEREVLKYRDLIAFPGVGELIYAKDDNKITVTSPDHEKVELTIEKDTWLLFSHRRPPRGTTD